jgi:hypothetical protein
MATDATGAVVITGDFSGNVDFGAGNLSTMGARFVPRHFRCASTPFLDGVRPVIRSVGADLFETLANRFLV